MSERNATRNRNRLANCLRTALFSTWDCVELLGSAAASVKIKLFPQVSRISAMALPLVIALLIGCTGGGSPSRLAAPISNVSLQVENSALPVGAVQSRYAATLTASGGVPPYSWNVIEGELPSGLTLDSTTGTIGGIPTTAGAFSFTTKVQDSKATSVSAGLSVNISTVPAPTVSTVSPNSGSAEGGTYVTISGHNFQSGASIQFGSLQPISVQMVNSNELQAVTPAEPGGIVSVTVRNSDGQIATAANAFSFIPQAPTGGTATSWSPAELGVPWASDFTSIAANVINVKTDPRLSVTAKGDGLTDDTAALRAAIHLASSSGGGVVFFPVGDYKIIAPSNAVRGTPLVVPSRVILQGSNSATSRIFVNDPDADRESDGYWTYGGIDFQGSSLSGMTDLGVYAISSSTSPCALLWNRGTGAVSELFFNNLDVHLANCRSFWFESTTDLLVRDSKIDSSNSSKIGNAAQYGPIYLADNSNISFINDTVTYHFGRVRMENNKNLLMQGNAFIRDAENEDMQNGTAVESGGVELSFSQNVQVLKNVIQTVNAPSDENDDGEAILTQESNVQNVLDAGSATAITPTTLTDANALWGPMTTVRLARYPEVIAILTGPGTGEWRAIQAISANTKTLTLNQPWKALPEVGDLYSIFEWTLMNATIQGNRLIDNPNGIFLYDGCYNCSVQDNQLTNSRGILLRTVDKSVDQSVFPEGRRVHEVALNDSILNNTVSNTSGIRPSYIALDTEAFSQDYRGMGMMNIDVAGNIVDPYPGNPSQTYKPGPNEITHEGFFPCFLFGPAAIKDPLTTVFQNVSFSGNSQSLSVHYDSYFAQFTTQACVSSLVP